MIEKIFLPIDRNQADMALDSAMYGTSCHKPSPYWTCQDLGWRLVKEHETVYEENTPKAWIEQDKAWCYIKGWIVEVEKPGAPASGRH